MGMSRRRRTLSQKLKRPGWRATVPDSKLPKELLRKRRLNRSLDSTTYFTQPLTRRKAAHEREAAVGLKYGALDDQLAREGKASDQQSANIGSYYDKYGASIRDIQARQQAATKDAQSSITTARDAASTRDDKLRAELQTLSAKDAALRGTQVGSAGDEAAVQASQNRRAIADSAGALVGAQGLNNYSYLLDKERISGGDKISDLLKENKYRRGISEKTANVAREKGDFRQQYMADTRDKERKYGLERAAFGLQEAKAGSDAKSDRLSRRLQKERLKLDKGRLSETERHNMAMERKSRASSSRSGSKKMTASQQRSLYKELMGYASKAEGHSEDYSRKKLSAAGLESDLQDVVLDLANYGGVTSRSISILHRYGMKVNGKFKKVRKPKMPDVSAIYDNSGAF